VVVQTAAAGMALCDLDSDVAMAIKNTKTSCREKTGANQKDAPVFGGIIRLMGVTIRP